MKRTGISEWGHNFRPEYLKLPDYQKEFTIPQTLLLTATATERVIEDMCAKFDILRENVMASLLYVKCWLTGTIFKSWKIIPLWT